MRLHILWYHFSSSATFICFFSSSISFSRREVISFRPNIANRIPNWDSKCRSTSLCRYHFNTREYSFVSGLDYFSIYLILLPWSARSSPAVLCVCALCIYKTQQNLYTQLKLLNAGSQEIPVFKFTYMLLNHIVKL